MIAFDSYEFEFTLNNKVQEIDPINYSFSIRDSIHKMYPELTMEIMDITGLFQEVLLFTEGISLKLKYGLKDKSFITCPFVLINDELPGTLTYDSMGGKVSFSALHEWFNKQEVKADAYSGRITEVIKNSVISNYEFTSQNINDTGCDTTWYRPLYNQKDFIEKILLPNSFSNNSYDSPFFCFIDSNNEFNFRNYHSMITTSPVKSVELLNFAQQPDIDSNYSKGKSRLEDGIGDRFIFSLKRWKQGSLITKRLRNRKLYYRDLEDGSYTESADHITSYPKGELNYLPIFKDTLTSGIFNLDYTETGALLECQKGRKINSMKDTFFLERFIMTLPLDISLRAGKLIEITLPISVQENPLKSFNYTGNYLIESSDHVWNSENKFGYTQLLISRKFQTVPNTSLIKPYLMQGGV